MRDNRKAHVDWHGWYDIPQAEGSWLRGGLRILPYFAAFFRAKLLIFFVISVAGKLIIGNSLIRVHPPLLRALSIGPWHAFSSGRQMHPYKLLDTTDPSKVEETIAAVLPLVNTGA
jgi:hypothetical protein